jgi:hypothetical protein
MNKPMQKTVSRAKLKVTAVCKDFYKAVQIIFL